MKWSKPLSKKCPSSPSLEPERTLARTVTIERVVPGGAGLARLDSGEVVLVQGGLPGDRVELSCIQSRGGVLRAEVGVLLEAGPGRIQPTCPFASECGGCDLMAADIATQRAIKLDILRDALRRTGGIEWRTIKFISSAEPFAYRERIRLHQKAGRLGFFRPGTHDLVEVEQCRVANPRLNEGLQRLRALIDIDRPVFEALASIELRVVSRVRGHGFQPLLVQLNPISSGPSHRNRRRGHKRSAPSTFKLGEQQGRTLVDSVQAALGEGCVVRLGRADVAPVEDPATELAYVLSRPGGFSQVNPSVNRELIDRVMALVREHQLRTFVDLYCGNGNFSLPLLALGLDGVGVEFDREARDMAQAAYRAQVGSTWGEGRFVAQDSGFYAKEASKRDEHYDLVIVDPPRSGAKAVIDWVSRVCAKFLIMVSCDPVTLARDLKVLTHAGFTIEEISVADMFPQTHHVESLVILRKQET